MVPPFLCSIPSHVAVPSGKDPVCILYDPSMRACGGNDCDFRVKVWAGYFPGRQNGGGQYIVFHFYHAYFCHIGPDSGGIIYNKLKMIIKLYFAAKFTFLMEI